MIYKVNDLYACIQGEGAQTGVPMVMIRLQGCPVGCPFCDTKETWDTDVADQTIELSDALGVNKRWTAMTAGAIANAANRLIGGNNPWALISGGEPLLQNCDELTDRLRNLNFRTALETSGTADVSGRWDWLTVSPKVGMPGGRVVLKATTERANEIKWVVGKQEDLDALDAFLDAYPHPSTISLQPMSLNAKATQLCVARCIARSWRLSVQTHKVINPDWKTVSV
jgi:7-carboxy-7-deazaguanine synthase